METRISVVIPAYNAEKYILKTLQSVIGQNYPAHEIIVVDDGSSDKTKKILMKYTPSIRYIYQNNKGPSAARNHGIRETTGDYIAFLDADDLWYENHLSDAVKIFKKEANAIWFSCAYHVIDNGCIKKTVRARPFANMVNYFDQALINDIVNASSVIIKKVAFDTIGYFNENFKYGEDLNMWFRIALFSKNIGYSDVVGTAQIRTEGSLTFNKEHYDLTNSLKVLSQTEHENSLAICEASVLLINKWIHDLILSGIYYRNKAILQYIYKKWWHRLSAKSKIILSIGLTLPLELLFNHVMKQKDKNSMSHAIKIFKKIVGN